MPKPVPCQGQGASGFRRTTWAETGQRGKRRPSTSVCSMRQATRAADARRGKGQSRWHGELWSEDVVSAAHDGAPSLMGAESPRGLPMHCKEDNCYAGSCDSQNDQQERTYMVVSQPGTRPAGLAQSHGRLALPFLPRSPRCL